jgi:hypothetical protein
VSLKLYLSARARRFNRAFACVLVVVFLLTLLKGFRLPNLYSAAHLALNYSQGFVRRGFMGELSRHVFGDLTYKYWFFVGWAFVVMGLIAVLLALLLRRALRAEPRDVGFKCALLAFAASPGLVMFVHTVGYFDQVGFLALLALLLWMPRTKFRLLPFYVVIVVGFLLGLTHEILVPMFGPVIFLAMVCHVIRRAPDTTSLGSRGVMAAHAVIAIGAVLVLSGVVSTVGGENKERVLALKAYIEQRADYGLRPDLFEALYRSSKENLFELMPWYWRVDRPLPLIYKSCLSVLPSFAFLIAYGLHSILRLVVSKLTRWILAVSFVGACVAPLALNFVGWDWNRWNGIAVMASFGAVLTLKLFLPSPRRRSSLVLATLGAMAVAISLASDTVLFDETKVQFFPFEEQQRLIERIMRSPQYYRPRF